MRYLLPLFSLLFALPVFAQTNPAWTTPLPPFQIADNLYLCRQRGPGRLPGHDAGREHSHQRQPRLLAAADSREHRDPGFPLGGHKNPAQRTGALRPHGRSGRNPARDAREEHGHGGRCRGCRKRRSHRLPRGERFGAALSAGACGPGLARRRHRRSRRHHAHGAQDGGAHARLHDLDLSCPSAR